MPCRERRIIPNGLNSRLLAPAPAFPFSPSCRHQSAAHHSVVLGTNSRPQQTCRLRLLKIFVRITKACSRAVIRLSKITHSMRANARRPLAAINPVKPSSTHEVGINGLEFFGNVYCTLRCRETSFRRSQNS